MGSDASKGTEENVGAPQQAELAAGGQPPEEFLIISGNRGKVL